MSSSPVLASAIMNSEDHLCSNSSYQQEHLNLRRLNKGRSLLLRLTSFGLNRISA